MAPGSLACVSGSGPWVEPLTVGPGVAQIAARLFLGDGTVRNYLSSAIGKTGSRNRVEAVHVAEENGWL
jgi:DNA-binding NarL/FixJ family response regulator